MGSKVIAIDWSHTKDLTTYDGKKLRVESQKTLLSRLSKDGKGEESKKQVKSTNYPHSPSVVLEQGCPLNLVYNILLTGTQVYTIDNHTTEQYRKEHGVEKTDENDAKIIYELSLNGAKDTLRLITLDSKLIQLKDLYHQYCRYQKARVAMQNMRRGHLRHYGGLGESIKVAQSNTISYPKPDYLPYDIAIDTLQGKEKGLLKKLQETMKGIPSFESGGESKALVQSIYNLQPPHIKGLGQRIWIGLMVTCNPSAFKCLSAYLRYCGLTSDVIKSHKYSRHAKMLYHMLAESILKAKDPVFRPIYDKCKEDIANTHPDYTKLHIHNAALNRTATFLAKNIYFGLKETI